MNNDPDLDAAYDIDGPEGARKLYANWAKTYDSEFIATSNYVLADHVAMRFSKLAEAADSPIADIGAGTGRLAESLPKSQAWIIDAFDISPEMLAEAGRKEIYRSLQATDLTQPNAIPEDAYGALVSAGTFTHGHLGPDILKDCLRMGKANALAVIAINEEHYAAHGFAAMLDGLQARGEISPPQSTRVAIYDVADTKSDDASERPQDDHANDTALVVHFRIRPV